MNKPTPKLTAISGACAPAALAADPPAAATRPKPARPGATLRRLAESGERRRLAAGAFLFAQGDAATAVHLVAEGIVETTLRLDDGTSVVVGHHGADEFIGDLCPGGERRHLLSARALTAAQILCIDSARLRAEIGRDRTLFVDLLAELAATTESLVGQANDLKMRTLRQRLAAYLVDLADRQRQSCFRLPLSKTDLARWLGTTPQALSRSFAQLKEVGIDVRGRLITITDAKSLRAYCNDY